MRADTTSRAAPWLAWVRAGIVALALVCLGFYLYSLVAYFFQIQAMNPAVLPSTNWTPDSFRQSLEMAGETPGVYAAFQIALILLLTLGYLGIAGLLLVKKPDDRIALVVAFTLVIFGTGFPPPIQSMKAVFPALAALVQFWTNLGYTLFFLLFYIFPDGRFVPTWTRWLSLLWIEALLVGPFSPGTPLDVLNYPEPWSTLIALVMFASFVAAQIYRYRRISAPLQRQQTKWVVAGMVCATFIFVAAWSVVHAFPALDQPGLIGLAYQHGLTVALAGGFLLIPVSMGLAILRYRLFEIDLIIRRTLVYTLLTGLLAGLYFGSVVILQQVLSGVTAGSSASLVLSTLLIASLFTPLRRRVQGFIDRRFYRQKYDAARALEEFSAAARREVELERLSGQLVGLVEQTIQPEGVWLWIRAQDWRHRTHNSHLLSPRKEINPDGNNSNPDRTANPAPTSRQTAGGKRF